MDSMASRFWGFGLAAIAVAILVAGVWFVDPNVLAAIVTALAGLGIVVVTQIFDRRRQIAEAHRDRKVKIYEKFAQLFVDLVEAGKRGETKAELLKSGQVYKSLVNFNRDVLLWASPSVVRAFLDLQAEGDALRKLQKMDTMLQAIREDLGLSNSRLRQGDLVKLFDPTAFDKMLGR